MPPATHPPAHDLSAFALGRLDEAASAAVAEHLIECADCQYRVAVTPGDSLTALLRSAEAGAGDDTPPTFAATHPWGEAAPAPPAPPADLLTHPRYRLLRLLGAGGMGAVWLAEHTVMGRPVAVKVIRPELLARPGAADRFRREVRAAAILNHPNIVAAFDAEQVGGTHFLVMEHVPGRTLAEVLWAGPVPDAEACRFARDAARGLAHAHARGLVHRDVKPQNLILAADGTVKVLDFGLAAVADADAGTGLTGANVVAGTPDYIAPEQAEDARSADARSDVYALGCTLYHLLAGRVPFPADGVLRKLDAHRAREPEPPPGVSPALAAVVAKMMAKRPADRYQSAAGVAAALEPFCEPGRAGGVSPILLDTPAAAGGNGGLSPPAPRKRFVALGLLAATAVLAAGVVVIRDKDGKEIGRFTHPNVASVEVIPDPAASAPAGPGTGTVTTVKPSHSIRWSGGDGFTGVDVTADGRYALATKKHLNEVRVWDARTGQLLHEFPEPYVAQFTPDGRQVVAVSWRGDSPFRVYDIESGKLVRTIDRDGWPGLIQLARSGTRLVEWWCRHDAAATAVRVWDWATGTKLCELACNPGLDLVTFTPDLRFALRQLRGHGVTSGTRPVEVFDAGTGEPVEAFASARNLPPVMAVTGDGTGIICRTGMSLSVVDAASGKERWKAEPCYGGYFWNTSNLLRGPLLLGHVVERNVVVAWGSANGQRVVEFHCPGSIDGRNDAGISTDGRVAAVGYGDTLHIFRLSGPPPAAPDR